MMEINDDKALGWDSPVEEDGSQFVTLPDNTECTFQVAKLEKVRTADGKKPMAKLELICTGTKGDGETYVRENLVLSSKAAWKLGEFFRSIGQRKHGQSVVPQWDRVVGASGRCVVTVDEWTGRDGDKRVSNKVKRYLDPRAQVDADMEPPADEGVSFT
jgi:hypothetical protein